VAVDSVKAGWNATPERFATVALGTMSLHAPSAAGTAICLLLGLADIVAVSFWGVPAAWPERGDPLPGPAHPAPALPNQSAAPAHGNAIPARTSEPVAVDAQPPVASSDPLTPGDGVSTTAQAAPTATSSQGGPLDATVPRDSGPLLSDAAAAQDPHSPKRQAAAEPSGTPLPESPVAQSVRWQPVAPNPLPAPRRAPQSLTVHFGTDRIAVPAETLELLEQLAEHLRREPDERVEIDGHADHRGDSSYNQRLSEQRAESVAAFLAERGVASARIRILGLGTSRPLDKANNSRAWARNRRVEARLIQVTR
jgi:outer membrane protein OmpA-like peptidoglycan-associated protein